MERKFSLAYLTIPGTSPVDQIRIAAEAANTPKGITAALGSCCTKAAISQRAKNTSAIIVAAKTAYVQFRSKPVYIGSTISAAGSTTPPK